MPSKGIKINGLKQNTPEWLDWRNDGIGGSDAGAIMGSSPYMDVLELWQRKLKLIPDIVPNDAMKRGHLLEPDARLLFELEEGLLMPAACYTNSEHSFLRASLDGISADEKIILEIKCPGLTTHREALAGKIKPYYYTQMQHQMAATGAELCYYFSYTDLPDIKPTVKIDVHRDEEYISRLIEREAAFWQFVTTKTEPDLTRFSVKDAGNLNGDTRTDPAWEKALQELLSAKAVLSDAQAQYNIREARINDLMARKKQVVVTGNGVRVERIHSEDGGWKTLIIQEDDQGD
jgi:putative phage-type endonuclease